MMRSLLISSLWISTSLFAQDISLKGSDTLSLYMNEMIRASGLEESIVYEGGGSSLGETALVNRSQNLAAMSRAFRRAELEKAKAAGVNVVEHVIGLDGVGVFVNQGNKAVSLTLDQLRRIYSCEITNWSAVGGDNLAIAVYRRDDVSGTTDTFKTLVGITSFGSCVKVLSETADISEVTATQASAVGYAGLSALTEGNRYLLLGQDASSKAYAPTAANIRSFNYPLARRLYVYEAAGSLTAAEQTLLSNILDRTFSDPILVKNDFLTIN